MLPLAFSLGHNSKRYVRVRLINHNGHTALTGNTSRGTHRKQLGTNSGQGRTGTDHRTAGEPTGNKGRQGQERAHWPGNEQGTHGEHTGRELTGERNGNTDKGTTRERNTYREQTEHNQ